MSDKRGSMETSKIGAISTFLQQLESQGSERKRLRFFRGHSKTSYEITPSIYRDSGWIKNEATMLKELILRCPNDFPSGLKTFESLVKMQHYGLPTRLLDVTSNPLVALYFACGLQEGEDGEVVVFEFDVEEVKYFDSDTVNVISNLSRMPPDFIISKSDEIIEFNENPSTKQLLHEIGQDKPHFKSEIKRSDLIRVVCVKPRLDNVRIVRQEGAFLLFGCNNVKVEPAKLEPSTIAVRLTINSEKKQKIRDQLALLGISHATMFPEIEQVATHIKDVYRQPSIDLSKITSFQKKVFNTLRESHISSIQEIASKLGVSTRSVSRAVSKLGETGVLEVVGSGQDRRFQRLESIKILE